MKRDVKDHATCKFVDMLTGLLAMALPEGAPAVTPTELLSTCLDAVLPICNEFYTEAAGDDQQAAKAETVVGYLQD